jgi:hypothetical protein
LTDSKLTNFEARYEWYFAREQRFSIAGFFKKIDKPIESFISGSDFTTSFANAPKADLYGGEVEVQKYVDLANMFSDDFFATRRLVAIANYTYTKSKVKVSASDAVAVFAASSTLATDFFTDGASLTGQSDHILNLQLGMEDTDGLSAQTFILSYASKRVTSRGNTSFRDPATGIPQADIYEYPGFNLDFVLRQGFTVRGIASEFKFEARNILGQDYKEYQQFGGNRVYYNLYRKGTTLSASLSIKL